MFKQYAWVLYILIALGLIFGFKVYRGNLIEQGRAETQAEWDAAVERGKQEVARLKEAAGRVTVRTEIRTVEKIKTIREKGDVITKLVEVFVPVSDSKCDISGGFRVLHDAAVDNRIPNPAEIPNAAPTTATEVAATVSENYKLCNVAYAKVEEWQIWAKEQCALNKDGCPDGQ